MIRVLAALLVLAVALPAQAQQPAPTTSTPVPAPPPPLKADKELTAVLERLRRGEVDSTRADLERLARAGKPGARELLDGFIALGIDGGRGDFAKACRRWEEGADRSAEAAHFTAECYQNGYGGAPKDAARAAALYTRAGEGGYGKSWCALGNLHRQGLGVSKDLGKAVALCRKGADLGDPDAQTDLAGFYLRGEGVAKDPAAARSWYEKAAITGQKNAAFRLGQMAWTGEGAARDPAAAQRWFKLAYDNGRRDAAGMLGREAWVRAVPTGGGVNPRALDEAIAWLELATALNPPLEDRSELESLLQRARLVRGD